MIRGGTLTGPNLLSLSRHCRRCWVLDLQPAISAARLAQLKKEYEFAAKEPSNLRYGYVRAG